MEVTFKNREFRANVCRPIIPMSEGFWERQKILIEAGWDSFVPSFRLKEAFCDKELLALERRASVGGKYAIAQGTIFPDPEDPLIKAVGEKRVISTMSPCEGRLKQFMSHDIAGYLNFIKPYEEQQRHLRIREIERHSIGLYKKYENKPPAAARLQLYKAVMMERTPELGFTYDKELSTSHTAVFSKAFIAPWRLSMLIETRELTWVNPPGRPPLSPGMREWMPMLNFKFGLVHQSNRGAKDSRALNLLFKCGWFFPVSAYPFHHFDKHFENLQELEVIILFHLKMYSIIQDAFEKALYEGLNSALSLIRSTVG